MRTGKVEFWVNLNHNTRKFEEKFDHFESLLYLRDEDNDIEMVRPGNSQVFVEEDHPQGNNAAQQIESNTGQTPYAAVVAKSVLEVGSHTTAADQSLPPNTNDRAQDSDDISLQHRVLGQ